MMNLLSGRLRDIFEKNQEILPNKKAAGAPTAFGHKRSSK